MAALPRRGLWGLTALIVLCTVILSCGGSGQNESGSTQSDSGSSFSSSSSRRSSITSSSSRRSSITSSSSRRSSITSSSSRRSSVTSSRRSSITSDQTNMRYGNHYSVIPSTVHIYGYTYYKTRHLYVTNRNDDPTVCYNDEEVDNGTAIGYFVCPMADDPDSATYCCGDDDEQYCCDFWGDPGRTAGAVTGILAAIVVVIIAMVLLKTRCCSKKATVIIRRDPMKSGSTCESIPYTRLRPDSGPGSNPYAGSTAPYSSNLPAAQPQPQPSPYS